MSIEAFTDLTHDLLQCHRLGRVRFHLRGRVDAKRGNWNRLRIVGGAPAVGPSAMTAKGEGCRLRIVARFAVQQSLVQIVSILEDLFGSRQRLIHLCFEGERNSAYEAESLEKGQARIEFQQLFGSSHETRVVGKRAQGHRKNAFEPRKLVEEPLGRRRTRHL
jgi:hypothetical protein